MRVLLDTNIILDFFLEREPFFQAANDLFEAIAEGRVAGFFSASSATDIFYICRRQTQSVDNAREILEKTLALLAVCPVDASVLETAFRSGLNDFEDAVQLSCAVTQGLDAIVTRNPQDFQTSLIAIISISELMQS